MPEVESLEKVEESDPIALLKRAVRSCYERFDHLADDSDQRLFQMLHDRLESLSSASGIIGEEAAFDVKQAKEWLERLRSEAATGDDADHDYEHFLSQIEALNKTLPGSEKIML